MLTTKKTFQTKFLSTLLIFALVSTMILAPTALAAGFGGSSITTAVADSGVRNFTPTEAANDTEIQAMTDNSSVLNESDIIYMILTDRFYDADPTNNGTLNQEYRPGQLKYTQGGDWKGITQKLDYIKNLGVTAIWISPPSQNELLSRDGEESGYHGYFTHDYNSADPHFGTKQDLIDLVSAAHRTQSNSGRCSESYGRLLTVQAPPIARPAISRLPHSTILTGIITMVILQTGTMNIRF